RRGDGRPGRAVSLRLRQLLLGDADGRHDAGRERGGRGSARARGRSGLRGRAAREAVLVPHVEEYRGRDREYLSRRGTSRDPGPARSDGVHRGAGVPVRRGGADGRARRDQGLADDRRGAARGPSYFADASTIGPSGCGTPASVSSVTANTFTGLPPSTGAIRWAPCPEPSTWKTPAGCGAASPIVHSSYAFPAGADGRLATN